MAKISVKQKETVTFSGMQSWKKNYFPTTSWHYTKLHATKMRNSAKEVRDFPEYRKLRVKDRKEGKKKNSRDGSRKNSSDAKGIPRWQLYSQTRRQMFIKDGSWQPTSGRRLSGEKKKGTNYLTSWPWRKLHWEDTEVVERTCDKYKNIKLKGKNKAIVNSRENKILSKKEMKSLYIPGLVREQQQHT